MRAVGFRHSLPIDREEALIDVEIDKPVAQGRDLLVEVKAVSVNPVDTKVRKRADPKGGEPKILGYDATGVVAAVGPDATLFKPGDAVWYAGSIIRPGTNSEFHLVDERIVGAKPKSLDFAPAAALPLTSITAWEVLFDRFGIARDGGQGQSLHLPSQIRDSAWRTLTQPDSPQVPTGSSSGALPLAGRSRPDRRETRLRKYRET